jgi:hypothetical protein
MKQPAPEMQLHPWQFFSHGKLIAPSSRLGGEIAYPKSPGEKEPLARKRPVGAPWAWPLSSQIRPYLPCFPVVENSPQRGLCFPFSNRQPAVPGPPRRTKAWPGRHQASRPSESWRRWAQNAMRSELTRGYGKQPFLRTSGARDLIARHRALARKMRVCVQCKQSNVLPLLPPVEPCPSRSNEISWFKS